jgi:hypothetical protein
MTATVTINGDLNLSGGTSDGRVNRVAALNLGVNNTAPSAPVVTVVGTLSGTGEVGSPLTMSPGTATGSLLFNRTYQFKKDGSNIGTPTISNVYTPVTGDALADITCVEIFTNTYGSTNATASNAITAYLPLDVVVTAIPDDDADGVYSLAATVTGGLGTKTYLWELILGDGTITDEDSLTLAELTVVDTDDYTVRLTVSDDTGDASDTEDFSFTAPPPPPDYAVWDTTFATDRTYSNSNKTVALAADSAVQARSTISKSSGKWVFSITPNAKRAVVGLAKSTWPMNGIYPGGAGGVPYYNAIGYYGDGGTIFDYPDGNKSAIAGFTTDEIIWYVDLDTGVCMPYKAHTAMYATDIAIPGWTAGAEYFIVLGNDGGGVTGVLNAGDSPTPDMSVIAAARGANVGWYN